MAKKKSNSKRSGGGGGSSGGSGWGGYGRGTFEEWRARQHSAAKNRRYDPDDELPF